MAISPRRPSTATSIKIGKAGSTMMACAPALMDQERKFFAALGVRPQPIGSMATASSFLVDASGVDIVRFVKRRADAHDA